jgi:hypothetical protein
MWPATSDSRISERASPLAEERTSRRDLPLVEEDCRILCIRTSNRSWLVRRFPMHPSAPNQRDPAITSTNIEDATRIGEAPVLDHKTFHKRVS